MSEKQAKIIKIMAIITGATIISSISAVIGYVIGYCNGFDKRVDASECKPARKWYFDI